MFFHHWFFKGQKQKLRRTHLELPKIQQSGELERAPTSKLDSRAEEVQREGGRHGTEELEEKAKRPQGPSYALSGEVRQFLPSNASTRFNQQSCKSTQSGKCSKITSGGTNNLVHRLRSSPLSRSAPDSRRTSLPPG